MVGLTWMTVTFRVLEGDLFGAPAVGTLFVLPNDQNTITPKYSAVQAGHHETNNASAVHQCGLSGRASRLHPGEVQEHRDLLRQLVFFIPFSFLSSSLLVNDPLVNDVRH